MLSKIFIYSSVLVLVSSSHILFQKRQGSYDITRSGRYTIVNCGNRDAARLVNLLDDLWNVLQASIGDASLVSPSPAFRTFFNSASNAPYVKQLLTNVTTGVSLYPPEQPFQQTGSPLFICATAGGQVVGQRGGIDYYFQCLLDAYDSLMAISGTPYIVVCPYLFASGVSDSPPAHNCLSVNTSINRFRALGVDFTKFKVWVLLEAILKYYIYATTGSSGNIATDANRCLRLGAKQMLENPYDFPSPLVLCSSRLEAPRHGAPVLPRMHNADLEIYIRSNYIYYVASVYGQCRDFPDLSVPRRVPLENTTISDLNHEGPNRTSPAAFAVSSQPILINSSGSIDARSA